MMAQAGADRDFCIAMLPKVSRTFAACIGLLPQPVQHRVLVAYLLCRIADTIEDCARMPAARKRELLAAFRASLDQDGGSVPGLAEAFAQSANADELLTREADATLREFRSFPRQAREAIRPWVQEMCDGMAGYAGLQPRPDDFQALERVADLDRYCWYVAGTVGHLLTDLFRVQSPRIDDARYTRLKARATDFGLGLQLVNIIKDVADDRVRGWSFVPRELCAESGFTPEELLHPAHRAQADAVMRRLITKARGHLDGALQYCLELPAADYRLRLFCLAPLFFAIRTLTRAGADPRLLDPAHKVKISRREVYRTLAAGYLVAPSNALVAGYYRRLSGASTSTSTDR
jgi:farnesyl-diphosphate farnesyltransferase